uniref:Uncharacterized protein n=1 Tax=Lotus japonicus TaxID=34305 RepID=I3S1G3_LOTJA|nr:unknown [Lotus japonicus]
MRKRSMFFLTEAPIPVVEGYKVSSKSKMMQSKGEAALVPKAMTEKIKKKESSEM